MLYIIRAVTGVILPSDLFVGIFLVSICSAAFVYLLLYMVVLSARVGHYDLKLYKADPSSSEIIARLGRLLSSFVYLVAVYGAFLTLAAALIGLLTQFSFVIISFLWIPIIAMFMLNQGSLSNIIRTAKWKTLNEIQARIEQLHAAESLSEKEPIEAVNRLMDYHDRIKRTRNSAVDLGSTLSFINSLLLPLLAFILGNLDLVLNLFTRDP